MPGDPARGRVPLQRRLTFHVEQGYAACVLFVALASAEPLVVPAYEVEFLEYEAPAWPEDDKSGTRTCSAAIDFDQGGEVVLVDVHGLACPEGYRAAAREAMGAWRIDPYLVDGAPTAVRIEANLTFKPAPKERSLQQQRAAPAPDSLEWWRTGAVPPEEADTSTTAFDWAVLVKWPGVPPRYPQVARDRVIEGECFVRLYVDSDGRPYGAVVDECPEIFVDSSLAAVQRWRLDPMVVNGIPQRSSVLIRIEYDL